MIEFIALFLGMCAGWGVLAAITWSTPRIRRWANLPALMRHGTPRDGGRGVLVEESLLVDEGRGNCIRLGAKIAECAPAVGVWHMDAPQFVQEITPSGYMEYIPYNLWVAKQTALRRYEAAEEAMRKAQAERARTW